MASIVPLVSGPADYTNSYSCMQSVSFSFVRVSAQQSEEMSVSGEEIDGTRRRQRGRPVKIHNTHRAVHCRFLGQSSEVC